jgi:hypothetical protein
MFFSLYSAEGILIPMVNAVDAIRAEVQASAKATALEWTSPSSSPCPSNSVEKCEAAGGEGGEGGGYPSFQTLCFKRIFSFLHETFR